MNDPMNKVLMLEGMPTQLWVFRARSLRVVDGDTVDVEVDGGFGNRREERLRLLGINAPEMKGATRLAGVAARDYVDHWLNDAILPSEHGGDWPLVIRTEKSDAFGRYLATVWRIWDGGCLNNAILRAGHAVEDIR